MYNVLTIMIDCLRQDRFEGADKTAHTPNLDAFKEEACFFENHHSVGSNTTSVMGSWFTGLYPYENGLRSFFTRKFRSTLPTLASTLAERGYRTLATVTDALEFGEDVLHGFAEIDRRDKKKETIYNGYAERVHNQIVELNSSQQPWFYFVHSAELHFRRQCEPRFRSAKYGKTFYDRALSCIDHYVGSILDAVDMSNTIVVIFGDHGDNLVMEPKSYLGSYAMNKLRSDDSVPGVWRLREMSHSLGLHSRQKWVLRNSPLFHHDYHIYRFLTHTPLMVKLPNQDARRVNGLTSSVDMFPTLLDYLGIPMPPHVDGVSLRAAMQGQEDSLADRAIYQEVVTESKWWTHNLPGGQNLLMQAIVQGDWKFAISPMSAEAQPELYNWRLDPDERQNVYDAPENQALVATLRYKLSQMQMGSDRMIKPNPDLSLEAPVA